MRNIQINKAYCVAAPTGKKIVICKRHESTIGEPDWCDVEVRDINQKLEDEIHSIHTQIGVPHLDDPIVIRDTQGHDYTMTYRNNQMTRRSLYELFSKLLEKPIDTDSFIAKTRGKIDIA